MSFLLWQHRQPGIGIAIGSGRQVFRAAEVPLLEDAAGLVARLQVLWQAESARLDEALATARDQGRAEGGAQAREAAQAQLAAELATLTARAEGLRHEARQEVAALALQVVRKLLGPLPEPERQAALALQAARELLPARTWRVAAHPQAAPALRAQLAALGAAGQGALAGAEVAEDATLAPGDCRLDTEFGSARAGLDAQLARLAEAWGVALSPAEGAEEGAA